MAESVRVEGFSPSTRGFHFGNRWPSTPFFRAGPLKIGDASRGLCGGMVYSVRDFFEESFAIPAGVASPGVDSALYGYIVRRAWDSFNLPRGGWKYISWMAPPTNRYALTVGREWPRVKCDLQNGRLSTLGLIRASSFWPGDLGRNHQCLAWGFDLDVAQNVVLHLYDPNHPDDDGVTLTFNVAGGNRPAEIVFRSQGVGAEPPDEVTLGFFVTAYTHVSPVVDGR